MHPACYQRRPAGIREGIPTDEETASGPAHHASGRAPAAPAFARQARLRLALIYRGTIYRPHDHLVVKFWIWEWGYPHRHLTMSMGCSRRRGFRGEPSGARHGCRRDCFRNRRCRDWMGSAALSWLDACPRLFEDSSGEGPRHLPVILAGSRMD